MKKFVKKYNQKGTIVHQGKDPHDDNKWEEVGKMHKESTKKVEQEILILDKPNNSYKYENSF